MEEVLEISEKEQERRRKISEARKKAVEEKRLKGYHKYIVLRRREKRKQETIKRREKAKELERQRKLKEKMKKKQGRKKKRGRPKLRYRKVDIKKTRALPEIKYKVISCRNGAQNKFIGSYRTSEEAYEVFNRLKKESAKTIFPAMYTGKRYTENAVDEYILIKKATEVNYGLRNEYGKIVEQRLNVDGWSVIDKFRYNKEETFWVWGYDSRKDRKTITWIYENIVTAEISFMSFNRVQIYKNKLLVKNDSGDLSLIICKNESDCVRFYNKLEEMVKKDKVKQVLFIGNCSTIKKRRAAEADIMGLTGWNEKKVKMNATTK